MQDEFSLVLKEHMERYADMEAQDYGKLAYQSEFGPEHLISDEQQVLRNIHEERKTLPYSEKTPEYQWIGNGMCRFPLQRLREEREERLLARLFFLTAQKRTGTREGLEEKLNLLEELPIPGMTQWLKDYREAGCPPVRHSEHYREVYAPHYRLLREEYACYFPVFSEIDRFLQEKGRAVIAIDGRCGSGKTRLAELIAQVFPCNVLHTDDYYLPLSQRVEGWENIPCANMDLRRFLSETLSPASEGKPIQYRAYSCQKGEYLPAVTLSPMPLTIAEGSYSQHPMLSDRYNCKIFLTCHPQEQKVRLERREGGYFAVFEACWIPLEEGYLRQYGIQEKSTLQVDTSDYFRHG